MGILKPSVIRCCLSLSNRLKGNHPFHKCSEKEDSGARHGGSICHNLSIWSETTRGSKLQSHPQLHKRIKVILCYVRPIFKRRKKKKRGGWRDGSEVKSTSCPSRGHEFNSQHPCGDTQPSVMRSGALFWCAGIQAGRTPYTQ